MEYAPLGNTGLLVSRIALGAMSYGSSAWRPWVLDEDASRPFIHRALELGINFFDTADMYSRGASEEVLGRALQEYASRERVIVATKVFFPMGADPNERGLSRRHVLEAVDASLRRLRTDYIDLYQIHRFDPHTALEETLGTLDGLVRAGKMRYLGASSMHAWQMMKALGIQAHHGWHRFVSMQNHYNLLYREEEREMLPLCGSEGLGVLPWSPLARGLLAGTRDKVDSSATPRATSDDYTRQLYDDALDMPIVERAVEIARERAVRPAQVALAWLLQQQGVTAPIVGATRLEHLEQAVAAVSLRLDDDERARLEELYRPHKVLGHR